MRNIVVEDFKQIPLEEQNLEIVERKGIGHPDTICDSILDRVSIELSTTPTSLSWSREKSKPSSAGATSNSPCC